LQVERDAHAIDQHDALIEQLLVGDFCVDELLEGLARADELDRLRCFLGCRRKFVQHREIEKLKRHIRGNALRRVR